MVNRKHGLSAAKDLLRHADVGITAAYYIDSPRKATSGLGALLATKRNGKKIVEFNEAAKTLNRRANPLSRRHSTYLQSWLCLYDHRRGQAGSLERTHAMYSLSEVDRRLCAANSASSPTT